MDLFSRITTLVRSQVSHLLQPAGAPEARQASASDSVNHTTALLKTAQERADRLNDQLAQAETRERNAEQAWRDERAEVDMLEQELNTAVRAGHDEVARTKLAQLNQMQNSVQHLSDRWRSYATASEKLRIEISDLQAQLAAIRKRLGQATPDVTQAQQRLSQPVQASATAKSTAGLAPSTQTNAPASVPADQQVAKELDQTRITDLLKKRDTPRNP